MCVKRHRVMPQREAGACDRQSADTRIFAAVEVNERLLVKLCLKEPTPVAETILGIRREYFALFCQRTPAHTIYCHPLARHLGEWTAFHPSFDRRRAKV